MNLMKEIDKLGFVRGDKTALGLLIEVAEGLLGEDRLLHTVYRLAYLCTTLKDGNAMQSDAAK